jgi:hypothetical protein
MIQDQPFYDVAQTEYTYIEVRNMMDPVNGFDSLMNITFEVNGEAKESRLYTQLGKTNRLIITPLATNVIVSFVYCEPVEIGGNRCYSVFYKEQISQLPVCFEIHQLRLATFRVIRCTK